MASLPRPAARNPGRPGESGPTKGRRPARAGLRADTAGGAPFVLVRWLVNAAALYLTALLLPGIRLRGVVATLIAAAVLGVVNAVLRPLLLLLSLPLNLVTLGLFTFVVNALMLLLTAALVPGFEVRGFWSAFLGALVLGVISFLLSRVVP